jgi:hypothetical protein
VTFARLWTFLAIGLPVLGALLSNLQTADLAYHLRVGGSILEQGAIPRTDSLTFTAAGSPWQDQQWFAEVLLAAVFRMTGWTGLVVLRAALVAVIFALVFDLCRRGHATRTGAMLTLAAFALAAPTLALRPQLFGMALFAITLWLAIRRHEHPRLFWLAILVAALWANLHGSFVLAPLVMGIARLEDVAERKVIAPVGRTLIAALAATAATFLNPAGPAVWLYATGISTNAVITSRITEWQPPTLSSPEGVAFFISIGLVVALLVGLAGRGRRVPPTTLIWLGTFAVLGLRAVRGLAWWPIVAAVTVARLTADGSEVTPREPVTAQTLRRLNAVLAALVIVAAVALLPIWRPIDTGLQAPAGLLASAPSGVTRALRALATPADRLFAPQPLGSWFEFALPATPLFIDSRIELFPVAVWDDYDAIAGGVDGWQRALDRWGVTLVVVSARADDALGRRIVGDAGWREVFADAEGRIFVRSGRQG